MSKIPQGEWNAIAARYAQGESISRIAQSYGCTPPAIHYILKRYKQKTAHNLEQPPPRAIHISSPTIQKPMQMSGASGIPRAAGPRDNGTGAASLASAENWAPPGQLVELRPGRDRDLPQEGLPGDRVSARVAQPQPPYASRNPSRGSAFTAGLDSDLHDRAEAAIAAFLSSFDAALAEGSAHVRQRLRKAASDLMRVAARTTIVLDRLNASAEHAGRRGDDQMR